MSGPTLTSLHLWRYFNDDSDPPYFDCDDDAAGNRRRLKSHILPPKLAAPMVYRQGLKNGDGLGRIPTKPYTVQAV